MNQRNCLYLFKGGSNINYLWQERALTLLCLGLSGDLAVLIHIQLGLNSISNHSHRQHVISYLLIYILFYY